MNPKVWLCALLLVSPAGGAQGMREALEAAWARSPQARALEAQRDEVSAGKVAADSLLAGAPALGLSERSDRLNARSGKREWELEVSAPLWLPGQRDARQALAAREDSGSRAAISLQRLVLAGELREAVWSAIAARNEVELSRERLESARQLEEEVARRVRAGDLARSDELLARQETLAARAAGVDAEANAAQALQRYRLLTGLASLPVAPEEEVVRPKDEQEHPRILAARSGVERAGAALQVARRSSRENPEIAIQYQRERDEFGAPARDTVRFGVRIPFGTEARNAPLLAAAGTEIARADAEWLQARAAVESEASAARLALEAAQESLRLAGERQAAAAENLALNRKGFDLGELPLAQLLRAQAQSLESRNAFVRQQAAVAAARARLNQARGILP